MTDWADEVAGIAFTHIVRKGPEELAAALRKARQDGWTAAKLEAIDIAQCYEPRCDICPAGVTNAIRVMEDKP
jgi:hypothetical protein